ncbi:hypothetical protein Nepgr_009082 [Nepenthes gracilis]|uniref:Uncharacterized protein n=1 Tax=Nepenthes gracilis TaxID=150966 RepID=A0AAD3XJU3_NEPGR|nr:hypothetical protein Nepgr_009082 [Nepenthes gracilis]
MEQRDRIIADRKAEIAWLEAKLAVSGGELREQTAALETVVADVEAENAKLKAEVARSKEEDDRNKTHIKRLADRAAAKVVGTRMTLHEVSGALHARLLDGLNIGRHVARLVISDFPVEFINQRNRAALRKEDLQREPRDS